METTNRAGAAIGGLSSGFEEAAKRASREKTWDECTPEERTERLRQQVRGTIRVQSDIINNLRERISTLERHQHSHTGEVLVSVNSGRNVGMDAGRSVDPLA